MYLDAITLGILQGLTEFLPVSSSGHLVIVQHLLSAQGPLLLLDIILHIATALVVVIYYRHPIINIFQDLFRQLRGERQLLSGSRLSLLLLAGNAATAFVYLALKHPLRAAFSSPSSAAWALLVTGLVLILPLVLHHRRSTITAEISLGMALTAGLVQGLAIFPGLSRSGLTIVCLLLLGCRHEKAVSFSMLLSLPAICGALLLELSGDLPAGLSLPAALSGFLAAFTIGLAALHFLVVLTKRGRLYFFSPYCFLIGILILVFI